MYLIRAVAHKPIGVQNHRFRSLYHDGPRKGDCHLPLSDSISYYSTKITKVTGRSKRRCLPLGITDGRNWRGLIKNIKNSGADLFFPLPSSSAPHQPRYGSIPGAATRFYLPWTPNRQLDPDCIGPPQLMERRSTVVGEDQGKNPSSSPAPPLAVAETWSIQLLPGELAQEDDGRGSSRPLGLSRASAVYHQNPIDRGRGYTADCT